MQIPLQRTRSMEATIISFLKQGDQNAISLIYKNYSAALHGIIYKIVQSEEAAQEVLQDCFVKIWQKSDHYNSSKGRLFTWLVTIARNTAIDKIRSAPFQRNQRTQNMLNVHGLQREIGLSYIEIEDSGLRKIIASLEEKHRTLIEMIYFQGYSQREIEKELMIPLGTVKSRIRIAIKALRNILKDEQILLKMPA